MIAAFVSMSLAMAGVPVIAAVPAVFLVLTGLGVCCSSVSRSGRCSTALAGSAGSLPGSSPRLAFGMLLQNTAHLVLGKISFYSPPLFSSGEKKVSSLFGARFFSRNWWLP